MQALCKEFCMNGLRFLNAASCCEISQNTLLARKNSCLYGLGLYTIWAGNVAPDLASGVLAPAPSGIPPLAGPDSTIGKGLLIVCYENSKLPGHR